MSKGHILVVEENMDNYELVRFILERAGYDVFLAMNGRDGVSARSIISKNPAMWMGFETYPSQPACRARLRSLGRACAVKA